MVGAPCFAGSVERVDVRESDQVEVVPGGARFHRWVGFSFGKLDAKMAYTLYSVKAKGPRRQTTPLYRPVQSEVRERDNECKLTDRRRARERLERGSVRRADRARWSVRE